MADSQEVIRASPENKSRNTRQARDNSNDKSLLEGIGQDNINNCLVHCLRADYGSIALLNKSFRSLVLGGELYKLRKIKGVIEHWVYMSCTHLEWEAFDPNCQKWTRLPRIPTDDYCFTVSDKESLAVGTELLVFGKEATSNVIHSYSLISNTWSSGIKMNTPRCLFGSASLAENGVIAGGCDSVGNPLSTAEIYNSEKGTWEVIPNMHKPRKMCSGVFMDGKFYVIGGLGEKDGRKLTCGEEYNLETKVWSVVPNLSPIRSNMLREAPPLVAVVKNELYAADYYSMELRKYNKACKKWETIGMLPAGRVNSMNGWGLAFRACGDHLLCIGGPRSMGEGTYIEVNSWVPNEGRPEWTLLGRRTSPSFVYNCAVMGC